MYVDNKRLRTRLTHSWDNVAELDGVRVFAAVAELRNFRSAAKSLGVPRSTVSRRLAQLEERLGQRLLQRTTRVVALTDVGEAYLAQVAPALLAITEASRAMLDAQAVPRGVLKLTAPPFLAERVLGGVLNGFLARYPDVRLELELTDRYVDLVAEGYDVAFRAGLLPDSTLIARPLGSATTRCYASDGYLRARGRPEVPADLAAHDAVVFSGFTGGPLWSFVVRKKTVDVKLRARVLVNSILVACDAAVAGLGIARLPELVAQPHCRAGQLVEVLGGFVAPARPLNLVYPSGRHLSPRVRAFIDYVTAELRLPEP